MSKWILTLLLLATLGFTACSGTGDQEDSETIEQSEADDFEDAELADGEDGEEVVEEITEGDDTDDFEDADFDGDSEEEGSEEVVDQTDDEEFFDEGEDGDNAETASNQEDSEFENTDSGLPEEVADSSGDSSSGGESAEPAPQPEEDKSFEDVNLANNEVATPTYPDETPVEPAPKKKYVPVQKIKDAPFEKAGQNLNRVYVARPEDNLNKVSERIFGNEAQSKELLQANPHLKRGVKVGDKIYYQSPSNPDDASMKTFFEDKGMRSETYVSQPGENIRSVSEKLLGSSRSWMEIWATNPDIESKWALAPGTELRYWPKGTEDEAAVKSDAMSSGGIPEDTAMGGIGGGDIPPADPTPEPEPIPEPVPEQVAEKAQQMNQNSQPPQGSPTPVPVPADPALGATPPSPGGVPPTAVGGTAPAPTPAPPPVETIADNKAGVIPPPPPPPPKPKKRRRVRKKKKQSLMDSILGGKGSSENLLLLAGVLVLGLAGALLVIRRRRKAKASIEYSETQVGE